MFTTIKASHKEKARKTHTCDTCGKLIQIGEEHEVATYSFDGEIYDWRTCNRCKPYVDEAFINNDYEWPDGMNSQDFHEYMWTEHYDVAKEWWK